MESFSKRSLQRQMSSVTLHGEHGIPVPHREKLHTNFRSTPVLFAICQIPQTSHPLSHFLYKRKHIATPHSPMLFCFGIYARIQGLTNHRPVVLLERRSPLFKRVLCSVYDELLRCTFLSPQSQLLVTFYNPWMRWSSKSNGGLAIYLASLCVAKSTTVMKVLLLKR